MAPTLQQWDPNVKHVFTLPSKKINEGQDVTTFLVSRAYRDITTFLLQLNHAMFPQERHGNGALQSSIVTFDSDSQDVTFSKSVRNLTDLFKSLDSMVDEVPLDPGPRRFGNVAFRKWYRLLEDRSHELLKDYLPPSIISFSHDSSNDALAELRSYFLGSFGSSQRLDYGTGHELSLLAFLGCIWKLGGFEASRKGNEERAIVFGILQPYVTIDLLTVDTLH